MQQSQEIKIAAQKTQQISQFQRNTSPHQNKFDTLCSGYLYDDTTARSYMYGLFGIRITQYLCLNWEIQMSLLGNTEK